MHLAAAEQMQMEVVDSLTAFRAGADDNAVALAEAMLARDGGGGGEQVSEKSHVARLRFGQGGQVLFRDYEDVLRRLWVDIVKGKDGVILEDFLRGNLAGDDFAEDAVHDDSLIQKRKYMPAMASEVLRQALVVRSDWPKSGALYRMPWYSKRRPKYEVSRGTLTPAP